MTFDWSTFWWILALAWSLPWTSWALWRAARNYQKVWFVAVLIIQSLGILPIIYIFFFQKNKNAPKYRLLNRVLHPKKYGLLKTRKGNRKRKSR
mgnify:CR=1 FL=1|jgi:hypothetical protein